MVGFSALANTIVSQFLSRQARRQRSPALAGDAAHLGTDALTSLGVLLGLLLVQITGADAIEADLGVAEVLIHVEPESSRRDPAQSPREFRAG